MVKAADPRRRLYDTYCDCCYGPDRPPAPTSSGLRAYFDGQFGRYLPGDREAAILDVGCGFGSLLLHLRDHGYTNARGIDASPQQVAAARRLGLVDVSQCTALDYLRGRREEFDLVFAVDVLEHLERDELLEVLDGVHTALRAGGRLVLQVPNADGPFAGRLRYGDLTHERSFTAASITQALRACGFSRVTVRPVRPAVHGVPSAVRWALWHALHLGLAACLAIETGVARGHVLSQNLVAAADR